MYVRVKASNSHNMWAEVSSCAPHPLHKGLLKVKVAPLQAGSSLEGG
jgi:hypothetical protein